MAFQIRVFDTVAQIEKWITLGGEINSNGELILNKPLCMKSSESSTIKAVSVDDANAITAANAA